VAASARNTRVKLSGWVVETTSPPQTAPIPIPRFPIAPWSAKSWCRDSGGTIAAINVRSLGRKRPCATPSAAASTSACESVVMKASEPVATAASRTAVAVRTRGSKRSTSQPLTGATTTLAAPISETTPAAAGNENPRTSWR
jgi:hypothetical protein